MLTRCRSPITFSCQSRSRIWTRSLEVNKSLRQSEGMDSGKFSLISSSNSEASHNTKIEL